MSTDKPVGDMISYDASAQYSAADSLTAEYLDLATDEWLQLDTKPGGSDWQGAGDLAAFFSDEDPQLRLVNNTTGQVIGMDDEQARVTKQEDGGFVFAFEDRENGDNDFNDAVITLKPAGAKETEAKESEPLTEDNFDPDSIDPGALLTMLDSLESIQMLVTDAAIPEDEKNEALDDVGDAVDKVAVAYEDDDLMTYDEVSDLLSSVDNVNQTLEAKLPDSPEKNAAFDSLADSVDALIA